MVVAMNEEQKMYIGTTHSLPVRIDNRKSNTTFADPNRYGGSDCDIFTKAHNLLSPATC